MRFNFQKVELKFSKSGLCPVCGKNASRTIKLYQTLNPFNKGDDGSVKTVEKIKSELVADGNRWKISPVLHAKCEA